MACNDQIKPAAENHTTEMPAWRQRKLPTTVLWDVVGQIDREGQQDALDVLDLIERTRPGRIDGLLLRHHEAELERDARSAGYGSLADRDAATRGERDQERAEWVEWLDAGGRDRLLAWTPAPHRAPATERTVWLACYPDGREPVAPDPDVEWEVLGAGTSPGAAHRAYAESQRDRMLDPWSCVPDDPRQSTLTDVPRECENGDPITALLAPHTRYLRLIGDPNVVERVARFIANENWLDDRDEQDAATEPARSWREVARGARSSAERDAFRVIMDLQSSIMDSASEMEWLLDLVDRERPGWLAKLLEQRRVEREAHQAKLAGEQAAKQAELQRKSEERARQIAALEPLVEPYREAWLAAASAYEVPSPVVDGEPVLVLVQRYVDPDVELDGHNGIEAIRTDWRESFREALNEYVRIQVEDLSAEELWERHGDPASVDSDAELRCWMNGLVPLVVIGPAGVDVRALLWGIHS